MDFEKELTALLNKYSQENGSDTPDFVLAIYLMNCLDVWNRAVHQREKWYGRIKVPVQPAPVMQGSLNSPT